ncbi:hypothetical protein INT47_002804 [Mucor saturninus]|uniref:Uncharacterized protein n=1 Tax=Mucor saturninus TaxID=64648 RepID=A0A8H7QZJ7_9FUNG|nr:hypothetical protein INT47_002804 [Mucor saturninus]
MMEMSCDVQASLPTKAAGLSETSSIGGGGDAVNMLLARLDEGTQTIINLRSILTLKTAELNELLAQLELTNQAITTVESTTTQIESMLRDFGLSPDKESLLMNAEASLDSAIKSATSIYPLQLKQPLIRRPSSASTNSSSAVDVNEKRLSNARLFTTRIRYKPDTKHILRKLNDLLRDLELDSGKFFASIGTTDDFEVLQKAYVDLDIAKTISLSAKSNMKRRNILLRSARRRNKLDEIQVLGDKIREGVFLWMTYTRNTPLLVNGEDIITVLDREDTLLSKNQPIPSSRVSYDGRVNSGTGITLTPSTSSQTTRTASVRHSLSSTSNTTNNESPPTPVKKTHSRNSSIVSADSFPPVNTKRFSHNRTPSSVIAMDSVIPPVPPLPLTLPVAPVTSTVNNKKLYRQSAGPRLTQVKANVGLPRVRTTSITQQQQQKSSSTPPRESPILSASMKPTSSAAATISNRQSAIPLPPSQVTSTPTTSTATSAAAVAAAAAAVTSPDSTKKSLLKPPTQRGPGSTLRLRSMLAKRGQPLPPMPVRKNGNNNTD